MAKATNQEKSAANRPATKGSNDDVRTDFADGEPSVTKVKPAKDSKSAQTPDESGRPGAKV